MVIKITRDSFDDVHIEWFRSAVAAPRQIDLRVDYEAKKYKMEI